MWRILNLTILVLLITSCSTGGGKSQSGGNPSAVSNMTMGRGASVGGNVDNRAISGGASGGDIAVDEANTNQVALDPEAFREIFGSIAQIVNPTVDEISAAKNAYVGLNQTDQKKLSESIKKCEEKPSACIIKPKGG